MRRYRNMRRNAEPTCTAYSFANGKFSTRKRKQTIAQFKGSWENFLDWFGPQEKPSEAPGWTHKLEDMVVCTMGLLGYGSEYKGVADDITDEIWSRRFGQAGLPLSYNDLVEGIKFKVSEEGVQGAWQTIPIDALQGEQEESDSIEAIFSQDDTTDSPPPEPMRATLETESLLDEDLPPDPDEALFEEGMVDTSATQRKQVRSQLEALKDEAGITNIRQKRRFAALAADRKGGEQLFKKIFDRFQLFLELNRRTTPLPPVQAYVDAADSPIGQYRDFMKQGPRGDAGSIILLLRGNGNTQVIIPSYNTSTVYSKKQRNEQPAWFPIAEFITRRDLLPVRASHGNTITSLGQAWLFTFAWRTKRDKYKVYPVFVFEVADDSPGLDAADLKLNFLGEQAPPIYAQQPLSPQEVQAVIQRMGVSGKSVDMPIMTPEEALSGFALEGGEKDLSERYGEIFNNPRLRKPVKRVKRKKRRVRRRR